MRTLLLVLCGLTLVRPGFAFGPFLSTGTYSSSGTWSASDGTSGNWQGEMQVVSARRGYDVKMKVKREMPGARPVESTLEWMGIDTGNDFFDVEIGGKITGWGSCDKSGCQVHSDEPGNPWGETLTVGTFSASRVGWEEISGVRYTWKGTVRKK